MKSLRLFILLSLVLSCVATEPTCCPPGQALLWKRDYCWDPQTNHTEPTVLNCKKINRFFLNASVNSNDQLEIYFDENNIEKVEPNNFCFTNVTTMSDKKLKDVRVVTVLCESSEETIVDEKVFGYCMIVSVIFLALTAFVYGALPALRDVQGKSIINFCASLAIALGIVTIMKLMPYKDMTMCAVRGFLAYFFLIAAFFWTNAISIQVLFNTRRPLVTDYSWKTFKWYMVYAWSCPAVLTVCMAVVNFHPGGHQKPGIGLNHCWFFNIYQQWYYMYSVMSLLLAANICIFIYTSVTLWRLPFTSSHIKAIKYKFMMSVRLIVLMGLPWVFEMFGTISSKYYILTIIDIMNSLQGILVFVLLVVFRRRVVKQMYKQHWLDCISGPVEKHLAVEDDEEYVVQHTDVPMN